MNFYSVRWWDLPVAMWHSAVEKIKTLCASKKPREGS